MGSNPVSGVVIDRLGMRRAYPVNRVIVYGHERHETYLHLSHAQYVSSM